jgi:hypothetical protein
MRLISAIASFYKGSPKRGLNKNGVFRFGRFAKGGPEDLANINIFKKFQKP